MFILYDFQDMHLSDNIIMAQTFLKNHQPLMFMHVITMDVLSGKFPGRNLMPLFELIVVSALVWNCVLSILSDFM